MDEESVRQARIKEFFKRRRTCTSSNVDIRMAVERLCREEDAKNPQRIRNTPNVQDPHL